MVAAVLAVVLTAGIVDVVVVVVQQYRAIHFYTATQYLQILASIIQAAIPCLLLDKTFTIKPFIIYTFYLSFTLQLTNYILLSHFDFDFFSTKIFFFFL